MPVGIRLALAVFSKLSLLEAVTDSESLSCKTAEPKGLAAEARDA